VTGVVFYDQNANGLLDPNEVVRLPGVTVSIGGKTGQSTTGGRFTVENVPAGSQQATVSAGSLPAYFTPGTTVPVTAPQTGGEIAVPAMLAIGPGAQPNVYVAFGDSITAGDGSSSGSGYLDSLAVDLRSYWGLATVVNAGRSGTKTDDGEARFTKDVAGHRPAYVLILYGTNDWNTAACRNDFPCDTIDNLRAMVEQTRAIGAMPIVGTIPPVNPAYVDHQAADRNDWVIRMNVLVRAMAAQQRAPVAEVHGALTSQPSLPPLYSDFLHPNDEGYRIIARAFFDAITKPLGASSAAAGTPRWLGRPW
jgi:acyl-CoA thioesterase-1